MNENLNLLEILKDCPTGTMLYSPIFGQVEFVEIDTKSLAKIIVNRKATAYKEVFPKTPFCANGKYYEEYTESECMLFPSKEQRDWSKFEVPIPDKALVWGWNYKEVTARKLCFYSAIGKRSFDNQGGRLGYEYDNYELFKGEEPEWATQARKKLKD